MMVFIFMRLACTTPICCFYLRVHTGRIFLAHCIYLQPLLRLNSLSGRAQLLRHMNKHEGRPYPIAAPEPNLLPSAWKKQFQQAACNRLD